MFRVDNPPRKPKRRVSVDFSVRIICFLVVHLCVCVGVCVYVCDCADSVYCIGLQESTKHVKASEYSVEALYRCFDERGMQIEWMQTQLSPHEQNVKQEIIEEIVEGENFAVSIDEALNGTHTPAHEHTHTHTHSLTIYFSPFLFVFLFLPSPS